MRRTTLDNAQGRPYPFPNSDGMFRSRRVAQFETVLDDIFHFLLGGPSHVRNPETRIAFQNVPRHCFVCRISILSLLACSACYFCPHADVVDDRPWRLENDDLVKKQSCRASVSMTSSSFLVTYSSILCPGNMTFS